MCIDHSFYKQYAEKQKKRSGAYPKKKRKMTHAARPLYHKNPFYGRMGISLSISRGAHSGEDAKESFRVCTGTS